MKLVKINISFKCPMPECPMGDTTNGAECLRCVLIHIMGDQKTWDEVQHNRRLRDGVVDISQNDIPDNTPELTETDLKFLASPAGILMGQGEWKGEALEKAVELYEGSSRFRDTLPVLDITPPAMQLTDAEDE